jgi:hypothetical protein
VEPIETFEHEGYTCEIHYDEDPSSPADWDNVGTLATAHRSYRFEEELGDHPAYSRGGARMFERYISLTGGAFIPVSMGDHSGIWLYEGHGAHWCDPGGWDSGPVGYLYTTAEKMAAEAMSVEQAEKCMRAELRAWDDYVQGRVTGFVVLNSEGDHMDSCWGFYPDEDGDGLEYVRSEARSAAEWRAKQDAEAPRLMAL